jgi:hypothetical protein
MRKINICLVIVYLLLFSCIKKKAELCGCTDSIALNYNSKATANCVEHCSYEFNRVFYVKDSFINTDHSGIGTNYTSVTYHDLILIYDTRIKNAFQIKRFSYSPNSTDTFFIKNDSSFSKNYNFKNSMVNGSVSGNLKNGMLIFNNYSTNPISYGNTFISGQLK